VLAKQVADKPGAQGLLLMRELHGQHLLDLGPWQSRAAKTASGCFMSIMASRWERKKADVLKARISQKSFIQKTVSGRFGAQRLPLSSCRLKGGFAGPTK